MNRHLLGCLVLPLLMACSDDSASTDDTKDPNGTPEETTCELKNDSSGQYTDSCVQRSWLTPYTGTYESPKCQITVSLPSGKPALFELLVKEGPLAATYELEYEGGTGAGNDSYYRFTSDSTHTTTTKLNFGVGKKVSDTEELGLSFTVDSPDADPVYTASFQKTVTSPYSNAFIECGTLTREP